MLTAYSAKDLGEYISYSHTIELTNSQENWPISLLLMPEAIQDSRILRCKLGLFDKCAIFQVMPITKEEWEKGFDFLEEKFYGENSEPNSFLARKIEK